MNREEMVAAARGAIEVELGGIMDSDPDFDGFGVDTPETNRLAAAAVDAVLDCMAPPF